MKKTILILSILSFIPSFALAQDVARSRTINEFLKANTKLRVSKEAVALYKTSLNQTSLKVIKRATELAKEEKRKTILERDITQATDDIFRRSPISVPELMEKINQLSLIELNDLANQIKHQSNKLIEQNK